MSVIDYVVGDNGVAFVTLNSPETRNALSDALLDELLETVERVRRDHAVRVLVLGSSHERIFSAGGDLKGFTDDAATIEKYARLDRFPRLYTALVSLPKPVICAAGGDVLAGAFGLALACDLVIAKEGVKFGCPEINVGVFPFMISALIYRNVPRMVANQMMMTGKPVDASVGVGYGFVNEVVPAENFDETVQAWADDLATRSPLLLSLGKAAIHDTRDMSFPDALAALRAQLALAFTTDDIKEGVGAFLERRDPVWRMR